MKEKEEELLRRLIPLTKELKVLRSKTEEMLKRGQGKFLIARGGMDPEVLDSSLFFSDKPITLQVTMEPLLNLRLPRFKVNDKMDEEAHRLQSNTFKPSYGYWDTSGELDLALDDFSHALKFMIQLAEKEKTLGLLVGELVKTRRRVRALEYRLIPDLEETISFIQLKLSEVERGNLTRLMKVKERIR